MSEENGIVSLVNLGGGAAVEKFNLELMKVIENICDPNTDPKAKRSITLSVEIKPNEDRNFGPVIIQCKSNLAPNSGFATNLFFGVDPRTGEVKVQEHNPQQGNLFPPVERGANVVDLNNEEKEETVT